MHISSTKKTLKGMLYKLLMKLENKHCYVDNQPNKYAVPDGRLLTTAHHHHL